MRAIIVLWGVLVFAGSAFGESLIGIRDISLGMKRGDLVKKLAEKGEYSCQSLICRQLQVIKGISVDGEFILEGNTANPADARLWEIRLSFEEPRFAVLRSALVEKHGSPSRTAKVTLRLQSGMRKIRETSIWNLRDGEITITNFAATGVEGGKGAITMTLTRPSGDPQSGVGGV